MCECLSLCMFAVVVAIVDVLVVVEVVVVVVILVVADDKVDDVVGGLCLCWLVLLLLNLVCTSFVGIIVLVGGARRARLLVFVAALQFALPEASRSAVTGS